MRKYFDSLIDIEGRPIPNADIFVKDELGDPVTIYSEDGGAEIAQPIKTNSLGYYEFYAPDGTYTIHLGYLDAPPVIIAGVQIYDDASDRIVTERALLLPSGETNMVVPPVAERAGKFFAWGGGGEPVVSPGSGGADPTLRTDLAASSGAALIGVVGGSNVQSQLDASASKAGVETLSNKTFAGSTKFATNGSRIGITNDASPITPSALVEIANNGAVTCGLRVSSRWSGTTALPYQNNDDSLWETFNQIISDSANFSWSISAPNAYNDIPAGVHDSGERVGVYGWATSVNVPGYTHAGRLTSQIGVRGRAGFQSDIVQSPATASIDSAIAVKGEVRHDSPLATIQSAYSGHFTCVDQGGIIQNNYGVYSEVTLGVETNWSFYGAAGEFYNRDRGYFGNGSVSGRQSNCAITTRGSVNSLEFGNADPGGYGSNLGSTAASGLPFLAFCAEAEATGNTFRTRGKVGTVLRNGLDGSLVFARVVNANATGQSPTDDVILRPNGKMLFLRNPRVLSAPPASAAATGETGEIAWDDGFFYVCVADDTWKRAALATW